MCAPDVVAEYVPWMPAHVRDGQPLDRDAVALHSPDI
jgi:hypothetical protein